MNKLFVLIFSLTFCISSFAYPIDGYNFSGIKRLVRIQRILDGVINEKQPPQGALLPMDSIRLSLSGNPHAEVSFEELFTADARLQKKLNALFPRLDESYSIAILDISNSDSFRFASRKPDAGYQPGSVGKLAVVTAIFYELERLYPDDFDKRIELLKNKVVKAGEWAIPNIHTVPFYNPDNGKFEKRLLRAEDQFTLFEWLDHMLSVSSNGAASVVWREAMLMEAFCEKYDDLSFEEGERYFKSMKKSELSEQSIYLVNQPLRDLGIGENEWRLGTFFTRGGSNRVPPQGGSIGSPKGMLKWLFALEKGDIIDSKSSLEIKRLMYMTDRRIRYAANANLREAAVYFKSGSLYQCRPEPDFICQKYMGNKNNFMNSVAIIEKGDSLKYMVALMSNVLKKNSNNDHNQLAGQIDKLIRDN